MRIWEPILVRSGFTMGINRVIYFIITVLCAHIWIAPGLLVIFSLKWAYDSPIVGGSLVGAGAVAYIMSFNGDEVREHKFGIDINPKYAMNSVKTPGYGHRSSAFSGVAMPTFQLPSVFSQTTGDQTVLTNDCCSDIDLGW